jgi:hypothetical protein
MTKGGNWLRVQMAGTLGVNRMGCWSTARSLPYDYASGQPAYTPFGLGTLLALAKAGASSILVKSDGSILVACISRALHWRSLPLRLTLGVA